MPGIMRLMSNYQRIQVFLPNSDDKPNFFHQRGILSPRMFRSIHTQDVVTAAAQKKGKREKGAIKALVIHFDDDDDLTRADILFFSSRRRR